MNKIAAMNSPEAKTKREATLARKKAAQEADNKLMAIARAIPDEWGENEQQKLALVKSVYQDILGNAVDKKTGEMTNRPLADLRYFMFLAAQRKLNPFKNQIHAVYIYDSQAGGEKLVPITGIDGFASLAQRTGRYAGLSETRFEFYPDNHPDYAGFPKSASVDIYAYNPINGNREAVVTATVWWEEYAKYKDLWNWAVDENGKRKKNLDGRYYKEPTGERELNSTWRNRPKGQLEKCAQALAFRRAFPEETGGLYVMQEVDHLREPVIVDTDPEPQVSTRDRIQQALERRKAEGKSVTKGDVTTEEREDIINSSANPDFAMADDLMDDDIGDRAV